MTVLIEPPRRRTAPIERFVFDDVSWDYYLRTLHELGDRRVQVTYDDGRMEIMSPGNVHEYIKTVIGRFIETYAMEVNVRASGFGSVTTQKRSVRKGLEPDECYYVTTKSPRPKPGPLNLNKDPRPDLVVEVDITSRSVAREPIYAKFGIPELWRYDGEQIVVLRLESGLYRAVDRSELFPDLPLKRLNHFLAKALAEDQHDALMAFRRWVRSTLK
jgi:Uma2 family endonuclease